MVTTSGCNLSQRNSQRASGIYVFGGRAIQSKSFPVLVRSNSATRQVEHSDQNQVLPMMSEGSPSMTSLPMMSEGSSSMTSLPLMSGGSSSEANGKVPYRCHPGMMELMNAIGQTEGK